MKLETAKQIQVQEHLSSSIKADYLLQLLPRCVLIRNCETDYNNE